MTATALSRAGVPIRLTDERWLHIVQDHPELESMHDAVLGTIAAPDRIVAALDGARMAIRIVASRKAVVVVYRELTMHDGFVITAYVTKRLTALERRILIWPLKN